MDMGEKNVIKKRLEIWMDDLIEIKTANELGMLRLIVEYKERVGEEKK